LIHVQNVALIPSLYLCLQHGNEVLWFILSFCEVLLDGMHCCMLNETHRICKTIDHSSLACIVLFWKDGTSGHASCPAILLVRWIPCSLGLSEQ
jgi:hypothetical protein